MPVPTEADRAVEISLDGRTLPGPFRSKSGKEVTAPDDKVFPGHMQAALSLGGSPSTGNVTVTALFTYAQWLSLSDWIESRVGSGLATITELFLDKAKKVADRPKTSTGTLIRYKEPDYDAENGNAPAVVEMEFSVDG